MTDGPAESSPDLRLEPDLTCRSTDLDADLPPLPPVGGSVGDRIGGGECCSLPGVIVEVGDVATVSLGLGLDLTPAVLEPAAPLVSTMPGDEAFRPLISMFRSADGFFLSTLLTLTEALEERPIEKVEFWCRKFVVDEDGNGEAEARERFDAARC